MVEITVKAADSASAMEEIEKRLGSDALIISTNKVDGKIEIVASNDELSKYQKSQKPLVLDNSYRVRKFSEVLDEKTSTESPSKIKDQQDVNYHEIQASLETINRELIKLKVLHDKPEHSKPEMSGVLNQLMTSGFKLGALKKIGLVGSDLSLTESSKLIAKKFVQGKCPNFEKSDLFIVTGQFNSGKTLFCQKLHNFIQHQEASKECKIFPEAFALKGCAQIVSWISEKGRKEEQKTRVGILEVPEDENINKILLDLGKVDPEIKVSVIKLMPAGKSYEYLIKNFPTKDLENEYLAITKLDFCDLSMQEISAFIELNHKVMLFAGIKSADEGLFFAKVDKLISHITETIKNLEN